jgi:ribose transport system ATP-binding protein
VNGTPLVEMQGISKFFGAVQALHKVDFTVGHAEVVGLVGDNAAGKSTLMKILSGVYQADRGEIFVDERRVLFSGPQNARELGIEMIYQDFALVPQMDVTDNIFLGRETMRRSFGVLVLDKRTMDDRTREMFQHLGLTVPSVRSKVRELSGGQQQAVAIARATGFQARLVLMDEPTANLGATAIAKVRQSIRNLKARGVSIVIVSHRLEDLFAVCDRVVVLKHGRVVGERPMSETTHEEVLEMIVSGVDRRSSSQTTLGTDAHPHSERGPA